MTAELWALVCMGAVEVKGIFDDCEEGKFPRTLCWLKLEFYGQ